MGTSQVSGMCGITPLWTADRARCVPCLFRQAVECGQLLPTAANEEMAGQCSYWESSRRWRLCASKILDIFEGTQQIQQLIVARKVLGKTSAELK